MRTEFRSGLQRKQSQVTGRDELGKGGQRRSLQGLTSGPRHEGEEGVASTKMHRSSAGGQRASSSKGPEAGTSLSCLRNSRETGRPGARGTSEGEAGPGPEEAEARPCGVTAKNLDIFPKCKGKALHDLSSD